MDFLGGVGEGCRISGRVDVVFGEGQRDEVVCLTAAKGGPGGCETADWGVRQERKKRDRLVASGVRDEEGEPGEMACE